MALGFGKYKYNNFRGASKSYFTIEIFKKDYSDNDNNGDPQLYPQTTQARDFPNNPSFITYWDGPSTAGWSWSSSYGGSAEHTAGNTTPLDYVFDSSLLVAGAKYNVLIELAGISSPANNKQILVKLGNAVTQGFTTNGVHEQIVTADGGQLSLDPTFNFQGFVKRVELTRYFEPPTEFKTQGEGFTLTYNGKGGTRKRNFIASECKINYLVEDDATEDFLYSLVSGGVREYYVRIYRSQYPYNTTQGTAPGQIFWYGYIMPAFDSLQNMSYPYTFTITANDSYGFYSKIGVQQFDNEDDKTARHSIRNILRGFMVDNHLGDIEQDGQASLVTNLDWWQTTDSYGTFNPALKYHISKGFVTKPTTYNESGEIDVNSKPFDYKEIDVFNGVLQALNLTGMQSEGAYWFVQPNSYFSGVTGQATIYRYTNAGFAQTPTSPQTIPFLETVVQDSSGVFAEQTDAKILGGSTITFEPALKRVEINFEPGFSNFSVSPGQNLTTEFYAGSIQSGEGNFFFSFEAKHKEKIDNDDFNFNPPESFPAPIGNVDWEIIDSSFLTTGTLKIKVTDGSQTKYLATNSSSLIWTDSSATTITVYRGYAASTSSAVNNPGSLAVGSVTDNIPTNFSGSSSGPCQRYFTGGTTRRAETIIKFAGDIQDPGFSGDVFIEFDASNNYYQANKGEGDGGAFPDYEWQYDDVNNPTPLSTSTKAVNITLTPIASNNAEDTDVSNGIKYIASQSETEAYEVEDLGNIRLGRNINNLMYAIQYDANPVANIQNWTSVLNFQRGNPTPDNPFNPTQLMLNEYLQLGAEPLEILQADLKSRFYSPHKVLKYSIENDGNYKYYLFLGGTYKAASEVWSGEWYKASDTVAAEIISETPVTTGPTYDPTGPTGEGFTDTGEDVYQVIESNLIQDGLGFSDDIIVHNINDNKIDLEDNTKGKIYDGQKLCLTFPDGSNPLILTANGDTETTSNVVQLQSFTPKISYPKGSVLRPLIYDFTNVITGGGTQLENLYQGITTSYLYLRPEEFLTPSTSNFSMYTRDNFGSVQPSTFVNRSSVFASFFMPADYEVTAIDVYGSANRSFTLYESTHQSGSAVSIQSGGVMNTTMTLTTPREIVVGKYGIIRISLGATTDKIYGAKITIQAV